MLTSQAAVCKGNSKEVEAVHSCFREERCSGLAGSPGLVLRLKSLAVGEVLGSNKLNGSPFGQRG